MTVRELVIVTLVTWFAVVVFYAVVRIGIVAVVTFIEWIQTLHERG